MKKFTFVLMMMLAFAGLSMAQTIENFECVKMNIFSAGANGVVTAVANPDTAGNQSAACGKMVRGFDGDPWAGWYGTIATPIDLSANKYVHIKVWKPRVSPTCFKVEGGAGNSGDVFPIAEATETNKWVEVVFDMGATSATGPYTKVVLIPDFLTPVDLTEDITIYFDEMYVNNDPTVGSAPVQVIENFDPIPLNIMLNGADDLSAFSLMANPDLTGLNRSAYVMKLHRDMNGQPWCGFWSPLPSVIDVTDNKFVHVNVWKPRLSPLKFKLEGGAAGTSEIESKFAQTTTGQWEDIVFDFSDLTGTYPIIAFMPDFESPVTLTEDIDIYFDNIRVNSDPNPTPATEQIFSVDMRGSGLTAGQQVFISGAFGLEYGTWAEPGTNANNEMLDPDGDSLYTIHMNLPEGTIAFKFFKGTTWSGGEPVASDRVYEVTGSCALVFNWGVAGYEVSKKENTLAGKVQVYPNPVSDVLHINTTVAINNAAISNTHGKVVGNYTLGNAGEQSINVSSLSSGMYFITFTGRDGSQLTQKILVK